ncbi:MAG: hypothetical protein HY553_01715 [Elusimicrobia bacterium]|nr:hypothetical protein [Elusimicrobiota bacterium]
MTRGLAERAGLWYAAGLLALAVGLLSWLPLRAGDQDLWVHLSAGRWMAEHGGLPRDTASFSFLEPPRPIVAYSWLFQRLAHALEGLGGYPALLGVRSALFAFTLALSLAVLRRRAGRLAPAAFALLVLALARHFVAVRPFLFSYAAIAWFLYVAECRPRWAWSLPVAAVLWMNLHGVYYPVLWLLAGAALAGPWLRRAGAERLPPAPLALCLAAPLATPAGFALLPQAFLPLEGVRGFVAELARPELGELATWTVARGVLTPTTALLGLLALAGGSLARAAEARDARPEHAALWAGGLALFASGWRFAAEAALLSLAALRGPSERTASASRTRAVGLALAAVLPVVSIVDLYREPGAYPLANDKLPLGVAAFLQRFGAESRVLHLATDGGYLAWTLPGAKLAMDMRVPHVFTAEDYYENRDAFSTLQGLSRAVERWQPDFVAAPLFAAGFESRIRTLPRFVPVFFDDAAALYVDAQRRPEVAEAWALGADPFRPEPARIGAGRLARMLELAPGSARLRLAAAELATAGGRFDEVLAHADALVRDHPGRPAGRLVRGDALRALGRLEEALADYRRGASLAASPDRGPLCRRVAAALADLRRPSEAYGAFRGCVAEDDPAVAPPDRMRLAALAILAGRAEEAERQLSRLYPGVEAGRRPALLRADLARLRPE